MTMCGCGISFESREIAQYAASIDDVVEFLSGPHNRARAHNRQVDDSNAGYSVVLETSATELAVRESHSGNWLIAANHFRCWPGFEGYPEDGHNMVLGQFEHGFGGYDIEDIPTMEDWKAVLLEKTPRYQYYENELEQHSSGLDVEASKAMLSRNRGDGHYAEAEWKKVYTDAVLYKTEETGDVYTTGQLMPSQRAVMLPAERSAWVSWGLSDIETFGPWVFVNLSIPPGESATFVISADSDQVLTDAVLEFTAMCDEDVSATTSIEATVGE